MSRFVSLTLNGVTFGMIYAAVALGLVLIWRATRVINFAQGALATLTSYVAVSLLDRQVNYWVAFVVALAAGLVIGALTERVFIRPLYGKPDLNPVVVSIGLLILIEAAAGAIWGAGDRGFQPAFSQVGLVVGHTQLGFSRFDGFILGSVLVLMLAMLVLFRWTDLGLRMRASAFAPEVARLLGVRVGRILTTGWALATFAGALAGLLVAPKVLLSPTMMDPILVYGFTAAVMG
ncbi:MAG: branched-chain amino acid ABC transporter permease, partial [Acidimicrobiales bacterium]